MKKNKDTRIVIIGAGSSGLTSAYFLRNKGYHNIILLERSVQAGGKCSSIDIQGHNYELGAGMIGEDNKMVMTMVKKYDIALQQVEFGKSVVVEGMHNTVRKKRSYKDTCILAWQVFVTYRAIHKKYASLRMPGFSHIAHEELAMPFAEFAKKYKFEALAAELELSHTGFGYGYFRDIPAAYVLKYYSWETLRAFMKKKMYVFSDGIADLWKTVAQDFDVRYEHIITSITRDEKEVTIQYQKKNTDEVHTMLCDEVIITSPLDELDTFLDSTDDEQTLFSHIKNVDYRTVVCSLDGFPKVTGYAPDNFSASRAGHPLFWYHRHYDTNIYTFYVLASGEDMSDDIITQYLSEFVGSMNGRVEKVHMIKHWKYFPHISSDIFKTGYYDRLEALQGLHHTYYAGELMNFSTVGLTADYADALIEKYF